MGAFWVQFFEALGLGLNLLSIIDNEMEIEIETAGLQEHGRLDVVGCHNCGCLFGFP